MNTIIYDWKEEIPASEFSNVINVLNNGGVVIFPTDTVYGIACNAFNEKAVKKLFEVKERNDNKPICVLSSSLNQIEKIAYIKDKELELINKYMPGALTIILDKKDNISDILTSNLKTVGVRIPNHKIANKILENVDYPLATTSANISGLTVGVEIKDFFKDLNNKVDIIIDGGITDLQLSSTVVHIENEEIKILRQGTIKIEEL